MQQLRELVSQLKADNERLLWERATPQAGPGGVDVASPAPPVHAPSAGPSTAVTECLLVIPRDRRCPTFNGRTSIGVAEWIEEIEACMRTRHLSVADQAFFIFDHLEGEAKSEIRFRSSAECGIQPRFWPY